MRKLIVVIAIVVSIPLAYLLIVYGTPSPCGALRMEGKRVILAHMAAASAKRPTSEAERAGQAFGMALGTMMLDPIINAYVGAMGPWDCTRALVKIKTEGIDAIPRIQLDKAVTQPASAPVPATATPPSEATRNSAEMLSAAGRLEEASAGR